MAHSARHRRILLSVLGALMLFCVTASGAGAQDRNAASTSRHGGIVKLPVVDKQDIRFTQRFRQRRIASEPDSGASRRTTTASCGSARTTGLYRYDGYSLKTYRHDPGDPNSLSDDCDPELFTKIGLAFSGSARTLEGSTAWTRLQDTFTHYRHDPADERSLSDNAVGCIYQDRGGALWVGTARRARPPGPGDRNFHPLPATMPGDAAQPERQ